MASYRQASTFVRQFTDTNGTPLSGGTLTAYLAGTTTLTNFYTDNAGTSAGSSVTLNARGEPEVSGNTVVLFLDTSINYKFTLENSSGSSIWTIDDISYGSTADYDTLASLIADTSVSVGDRVVTLGYSSVGDGGENTYLIVSGGTGTDDGGSYIDLDNGAQARGLFPAGNLSPRQFGATAGGATNAYAGVQAALNYANTTSQPVYLNGDVYAIASTLIIRSNTTLLGPGSLVASASLPQADAMMNTATLSGTLGVFEQTNIELNGVTFDGGSRNLGTENIALCRIWKTEGVKVINCTFKDHKHITLSMGGCKDVEVASSTFTGWGKDGDSDSQPALWCAANPIDDTIGGGYQIHHNNFTEGRGPAINAIAFDMDVSNNYIKDVEGSGVFARYDTDNDYYGFQLVITNNIIDTVGSSSVRGVGLAIGARDCIVQGNSISNCDGPGIHLEDLANVVSVQGNVIRDCIVDNTTYASWGAISVTSTDVATVSESLTIRDNVVRGTSAAYGVRLWALSGSDTPSRIRVVDNDLKSSGTTAELSYDLGVGTDCQVSGNIGTGSFTPVMGSLTLTAATGTQVVTGIGFSPRLVTVEAAVTSSTSASRSSGGRARNATGSFCAFSYSDASGARSGTLGGAAIQLVNSGGTTVFAASISDFSADGFTINKTTASVSPIIIYTCHP